MDLIVILLTALLLIREGMHFVERRDMLDRLMSRSLPEFKDNQSTEENHLADTSQDDDSLPIEQAEEDVLGEEDRG